MTSAPFSKGQAIRIALTGFGATTYEEGVVLKVDKKGAWVDNGPGNSPSGPFDAQTGRDLGNRVPGMTRKLEAAAPGVALVKGQKVQVSLTGAGETTHETKDVLKTNKQGIWLDNGAGNDPSGPFDPQSGLYLGPAVPGFSWCIDFSVTPKTSKKRATKP